MSLELYISFVMGFRNSDFVTNSLLNNINICAHDRVVPLSIRIQGVKFGVPEPETFKSHPNLEVINKIIIDKTKGLPLAAKSFSRTVAH